MSGDAAVHVYRVLQEALNNVARHSGATQAWVRLQFDAEQVVLEIEDHGAGFAPTRERRGIGMVAMRERAELLGGSIAFERPAEGGALVRLTVPRESAVERRGRERRFGAAFSGIAFLRIIFSESLQEIMADKISVLLVDDHSLVRRGFRRMLEDEEDIHVVGEASDGEEAVKLARSLKPQVIVMDCALPGISGLQATRKILQHAPETLILMLSMHAEETWVKQAMDAGARGYVLKNAMDLELGSAIRRMIERRNRAGWATFA